MQNGPFPLPRRYGPCLAPASCRLHRITSYNVCYTKLLRVKLYSTGGTQTFIESLNVPCNKVEDVTGFPSIFGGRVKTLHPKILGGILARRENEGDQEQLAQYEIPEIDLVIVDLYPFEATVASGASFEDIV